MRTVLAFLLSICAGCSAGSSADPEAAIRSALGMLATGITREDPILASTPVSDAFFMDPNVAARYGVQWNTETSTSARGRFRQFYNTAFVAFSNTNQALNVADFEFNGEVTTVTVDSRFDAVRVDTSPPETVTYTTTDVLLFQLENEGWRLVRWGEQPAG